VSGLTVAAAIVDGADHQLHDIAGLSGNSFVSRLLASRFAGGHSS